MYEYPLFGGTPLYSVPYISQRFVMNDDSQLSVR